MKRILKSHPSLLQNPDPSLLGRSNTSLHLAASLGHVDCMKALLELGHEADGISLNEEHQTPHMLAVANGHAEAVHLLCKECPKGIYKRDIRGCDAIMIGAKAGHDTAVQVFLNASLHYYEAIMGPGVDEDKVLPMLLQSADLEGNTALHFASSNGHLLLLRTLLAAGANSEQKNNQKWNPVIYSQSVAAEVYFKRVVFDEQQKRQEDAAKAAALKAKAAAGIRMVKEGEK